jgi:hypothetical protein
MKPDRHFTGFLHMPRPSAEVKGRDRKGKEHTLLQSKPYQVTLFQQFADDAGDYSNSIELYDSVPKYFASPKKMDELRINGQFLETLRREFAHEDQTYELTVAPARVETKAGDKEFYPTGREQLVEDALRKIAADRYLYELAKMGHTMNYPDLLESLDVCSGCIITIKGKDYSVKAPIFPIFLTASRADWLADPKKARFYVKFHPLVTQAMKQLQYRQLNYPRLMGLKQSLSRWLFKKMSHNFVQAKLTGYPYNILASTIIRDSGFAGAERFRDQVRAIDQAFEELKKHKIIWSFEKEVRTEGRKLLDVLYKLSPSPEFVDDAISANSRKRKLLDQAQQEGKIKVAVIAGKQVTEVVD